MKNVQKLFTGLDTSVLIATAVLILIGLTALYSASSQVVDVQLRGNLIRQVWWLLIGIGFFWTIISIDPRHYYYWAYVVYGVSIIGLILVLLIGQGNNVHRWIVLSAFRIQPSEFAKVGVVLALARFLANKNREETNSIKNIFYAFLLVLLPIVLIVQQPDLSTALVFGIIFIPIVYWAGLSPFIIFVLMAPILSFVAAFHFYAFFLVMLLITAILIFSRKGIRVFIINFVINIVVGIFTPYLWTQLYVYQQQRILTFLGFETDPRGISYQLIQSKVAIGSGGLFGKGFLQGTQTKLRFLPAQHTDFILSVIGEEFGFLGIIIVLGCFLYLLLKSMRIAEKITDRFSSLVAIGCICILVCHIVINVGMTIGIMPVTGLPLPFLSYGGSFLVVCLILVALIINGYRRQMNY